MVIVGSPGWGAESCRGRVHAASLASAKRFFPFAGSALMAVSKRQSPQFRYYQRYFARLGLQHVHRRSASASSMAFNVSSTVPSITSPSSWAFLRPFVLPTRPYSSPNVRKIAYVINAVNLLSFPVRSARSVATQTQTLDTVMDVNRKQGLSREGTPKTEGFSRGRHMFVRRSDPDSWPMSR